MRERGLEALAEEIRLILDEGVVAAAEDIDLCLILGAGWPFHLGGITPYLDRSGIAEKITGTRFHLLFSSGGRPPGPPPWGASRPPYPLAPLTPLGGLPAPHTPR